MTHYGYDFLITRHLIYEGGEYRITSIGVDNLFVNAEPIAKPSDEILRLPLKQALAALKPRTRR